MATTAQEVESIVVRLTGDGTSYKFMMKDAKQQTEEFGKASQLSKKDVDGFGNALSRFGEAAVAGYGLYKLRNLVYSAFDAFAEAETITLHLNATLVANGRQVEALTESYRDFAEQIESITTHEDDAVLSMLAMAETFDTTGETAKRAVRDAIALASVTGGNAQSLIRLTAAIAKGDIEQAMRFARMVPQLRGVRDQVEFIAKAEKLMAAGMKAANDEMQSASGLLKVLHRDYKNMLEDVGEVVADVIRPITEGLLGIIKYLRSLDPDMKKFLAVVTLVTFAVLSIGPAWASFAATGVPLLRMMADGFQIVYGAVMLIFKPLTVLTGIWTGLGIAISAVFSPIGIFIGLATVAIAGFIAHMGGVKNALDAVYNWSAETWTAVSEWAGMAWEEIKRYASAFWEWFQPIWKAFGSLMRTVWELTVQAARVTWEYIKIGAIATWQFLKGIWQSIFGDAEVNWEKIRDTIRDSIYFIEFTLLNFQQVAEYVWAGIKLGAVVFANFLLNNVFLALLGPGGAIVAILRSLNINWTRVFNAIVQFTVRALAQVTVAAMRMGQNIIRALRGLPALVDQGLAALSEVEVTFAGINVPSLNRLENQLRDEFNRLGGRLGEDFAAFLARRLAEESASPRRRRDRELLGEMAGGDIERGMGRPLARIDGALFGSLEAVSRILEYQQRILQPTPRPTPRLGGESATDVLPTLRQIAENTRRTAARPEIRVEPAGL